MDITSLIITFVGILIILALYIISRISRSKLPQEKAVRLPNLKNEDGTQFTSILDDIPARDGSTPIPAVKETKQDAVTADTKNTKNVKNKTTAKSVEQKQHILFISPNNENGLDGNLVTKVLNKNGFSFGDLDIYHYLIDSITKDKSEKISLFRVANGVDPWTLKKQDLNNKTLAGLSIVLLTPCEIDSKDAIKTFIATSHKISVEMNGVLKNQQQQIFAPKDEAELLNSV